MNTCYVVQLSCLARIFSLGLLDELHVRLRRLSAISQEGFGLVGLE